MAVPARAGSGTIRADPRAGARAPLMARIPRLPRSEGDALIFSEGFARIGAAGALPGVLAAMQAWRAP